MTDDAPDRTNPDDPDAHATNRDSRDAAPVDFDRLELVRDRLAGDERFADVDWRPEYAPDRLVFTYATRYYPDRVTDVRLEIAWYENDDFSIHYHESHRTGSFDHRWDRHPSDHNAREHVHPGPEAPTPGEDASHPSDWRDVLSSVLAEIETRRHSFWEE